jgi:Ca-activated chloride channel family protein
MTPTLSRSPAAALLLFLAISSINLGSVSGQEKPTAAKDNQPIMITVTVWNRAGYFVKGLNREAFEVADEKVVRPIELFESADSPVSVGILIDNSGSMQMYDLRETARAKPIGEAIAHFFELANPNNEYFLVSFNKTYELLADWNTRQALLSQKTNIVEGKGDTALYDSCIAAIEKLRTAHYSRRVLILMSDGQDNLSKHTFVELRELLRGADIVLYAIGPENPGNIGSSIGAEGQGVLDELAHVTGGKTFYVADKKQMKVAIGLIATELEHQFRIGFMPDRTNPPRKWRRLKIKVTPPPNAPRDLSKLSVRTRSGYYSQ